MNLIEVKPIKLSEKFQIPFHIITNGFSKLDRIISPNVIGWVGVTMSPCESDKEDFLEFPTIAIQYYRERGVNKVIVETKHMGSRACIFYDSKSNNLKVYSRGLFEIKLTDDERKDLLKDCKSICFFYGYEGFILDCEMEPWSRLSKNLINEDFLYPIKAYESKYGSTENSKRTKKMVNTYAADKPTVFFCFDIPVIKKDEKWQTNENIFTPYSILNSSFKIIKTVKHSDIFEIGRESLDLVINKFLFLTKYENDYPYEGIVIKLLDRQLHSNHILPPYIKCRGKDYLRIIYGIDYDQEIETLKKRPLKKKRIQSIQEYYVNLMINKCWIEYMNGNKEKENELMYLIAAYLGLREYGARKIDATL